jgi:hypothetical protein
MVDAGEGVHAVRVGDTVAVFARDAKPAAGFNLTLDTPAGYLLLDAVPGARYRAGRSGVIAGKEGVLAGKLPPGAHSIRREDTR